MNMLEPGVITVGSQSEITLKTLAYIYACTQWNQPSVMNILENTAKIYSA